MSIKNKLVTAVTTAGLLAGLFGSAFVPVANAAGPTVAVTSSNKDGADATNKTLLYTSSTNPSVVITSTSAGADDLGGYEVTVAGTTILSCAVTGTATSTAAVVGPQTCGSTTSVAANNATVIFTLSLKKLAAGASATIALTGPSDADNSTALTLDYTTLTSVASTAASTVVNATKSQAKFVMNSDGTATAGAATDVADEVIGGVDYFLPAQSLKKAIYAGTLQNANGTAILAVTGLIAEISNTTFSVNCDSTVDAVVSSTGAASVVSVNSTVTTGVFECGVFSDGAASAGGSWTLTVKVATTGTVVGIASGAFYGEIAKLTASLVDGSRQAATLAADDFIKIEAFDAKDKQYGLAEVAALTFGGSGTAALATASGTFTMADGTTVATKNYHQADATLCPASSAGKTATVAATITNGTGTKITSNVLTINCGATSGAALTIKKLEFSKSNPVPGETIDVWVYLADADGVLTGAGAVDSADFTLTISGADEQSALWNGTTGLVTAAGNKADSHGKLVMSIKAPATVGTTITISDPTSSAIAKVYTTNDAYAGVLSVGAKKLKATADFGPAAANKKIAFVLESASGTTKTYYRKANASGVASYTLALRGTWTVYATFGDEISDTGTMKK